MELLKNPYVVAAVVGGATFYAVQTFRPAFLAGYDWATPMNLGFAAAFFYIAFVWWQGDLRLPIVGRRYGGGSRLSFAPEPGPPAPTMPTATELAARVKSASRSMSDLLGPDQF